MRTPKRTPPVEYLIEREQMLLNIRPPDRSRAGKIAAKRRADRAALEAYDRVCRAAKKGVY